MYALGDALPLGPLPPSSSLLLFLQHGPFARNSNSYEVKDLLYKNLT